MAEPRKIVSLRRPVVAPPAAPSAPPPGLPSGIAAIPVRGSSAGLPPVVEFDPTRLLPEERAMFEQTGEKPRKMTQADLDAIRAAYAAQTAGPVPLPVSLDTPPLVMPPPVPYDQAPLDQQKTAREALHSYYETTRRPDAAVPPLPPPLLPPPAVSDVPSPSDAPAMPDTAGGSLAPGVCPHCGWNLARAKTPEPTEDDKLAYIQTLCGGLRYEKEYRLLGGHVHVTFRSLSPRETDAIMTQIVIDAQTDLRNQIVGGESTYWRTLIGYRALFSVKRLAVGSEVVELPPTFENDIELELKSNIKAIHDRLVETVFPTEDIRGIVTHAYIEFDDLRGMLQTRAADPDFWPAIR